VFGVDAGFEEGSDDAGFDSDAECFDSVEEDFESVVEGFESVEPDDSEDDLSELELEDDFGA
jgi:hypothetical protein